jgi:hypothetical protein
VTARRPRRTPVALVLALALAIAVVGTACGDDDGGAATSAPSAPTSAGGTSAPPDPAATLQGYLRAVKPIRDDLSSQAVHLDALGALSDTPDASWVRGAQEAGAMAAAFRRDAAELERIEAPASLRAAHADYIAAVKAFQGAFQQIAADLEGGRTAAVRSWQQELFPRAQRAGELVNGWRAAVIADAQDAGVPVPSWVRSAGTLTG